MVRNGNTQAQAEATRTYRAFAPRVDIFETDHELLLLADMPGANPQNIDLRYERGELSLRGQVDGAARAEPIVEEFETGDFYRVFQIHETIDPSKIEAEYKNGVLTVHLPKQEQAKPKQVQVRTG